jgi:hypothetical protein
VGVFKRTSFFIPIPPGGFNFSTDGALVDAWPYFPGLKVGHINLYSSFRTAWWRKSYSIPELGDYLELFSLAVFVFFQSWFIK